MNSMLFNHKVVDILMLRLEAFQRLEPKKAGFSCNINPNDMSLLAINKAENLTWFFELLLFD
jgi:hypothetical protein